MSDKVYDVPAEWAKRAWVNAAKYEEMYKRSLTDPNGFWAEHGKRIDWFTPYSKVKNTSFDAHNVSIKWFEDGITNVAHNCIDRHLPKRASQTAIIWEGDDPSKSKHITYAELAREVGHFANVLKSHGVKKGDRVTIYLPMIPEAAYAMLACARIGAIHSIVFGGFSPDALAGRIADAKSEVVITADEGLRGGRKVPLKANVDAAVEKAGGVKTVIVVRHTGGDVGWRPGRDVWLDEAVKAVTAHCPAEPMKAEDPLFILYTSGSTGAPKGVVHTTGGYLVFASMTHQYVFDYHDGDVYWCTADVGWVTGHSYIVYGPLANGASIVMYEGAPDFPQRDRFWEIVARYKVSIFYSSATAVRAFMAWGADWIAPHDISSLRLLGTVGEPINPAAWKWYFEAIGKNRCPIVDTWWQTETGSIMISVLPGATPAKPGSATLPLPGIAARVVNMQGESVAPGETGYLVIEKPWPSMLRTIYGDDARYAREYWERIPGVYFAGDAAQCDKDGYIWVLGRVDDVIKVAGHRLSSMEIESVLVSHPAVAEAAVVARPDEIKGEAIVCFVALRTGHEPSKDLRDKLTEHVANTIGTIARPSDVRFTPLLPKTRSGKIMRRLLRELASKGAVSGDTTTLEDIAVIERLVKAQADDEE
jgi:acetyl-CoA synthetase